MAVLRLGPRGGRGGLSVLLLAALLALWMSQTSAQITFGSSPVHAKEGSTATLTPVQITLKIQYYNWFRGSDTASPNLIVGSVFGAHPIITHGPKYTGRETGLPKGWLQISNVQKNDTGNYTIQMQLENQRLQQGTVQLLVTGGASLHPPLALVFGVILLPIRVCL